VTFEEAEKAIYKNPTGKTADRKERLARHRKSLNRKPVMQSGGKVFIKTKTAGHPNPTTYLVRL